MSVPVDDGSQYNDEYPSDEGSELENEYPSEEQSFEEGEEYTSENEDSELGIEGDNEAESDFFVGNYKSKEEAEKALLAKDAMITKLSQQAKELENKWSTVDGKLSILDTLGEALSKGKTPDQKDPLVALSEDPAKYVSDLVNQGIENERAYTESIKMAYDNAEKSISEHPELGKYFTPEVKKAAYELMSGGNAFLTSAAKGINSDNYRKTDVNKYYSEVFKQAVRNVISRKANNIANDAKKVAQRTAKSDYLKKSRAVSPNTTSGGKKIPGQGKQADELLQAMRGIKVRG